jgi:Fe-S-cluster-containing dehydrogenase component
MSRYGFVVDVDKCFGCHACNLACRLATHEKGVGAPLFVLELSSDEERAPVWMPYVCTQIGDPICGPADREAPPCVRACPTGTLLYGDLDDPGSQVGRIVASGAAKPLPHTTSEPRAYYTGRIPRDVEASLPDPRGIIPRKYLPLEGVAP